MSIAAALRARLSGSVAELERTRLHDRCRGLDVTPLDQVTERTPVRVGGEVSRIRMAPSNGVANFEVTISDGTADMTAVFSGRRSIPGIDHGRALVLEGVPVDRHGRRVIYNPRYTLVP